MELNGQINRRILLFSLVVIIVPLVAFPIQFGTELARTSLVNTVCELIYYGFIVFLFHRRSSLVKLVESAGVCLIYRLAIGAAFGLLIAAMYSMNLRVSLALGTSGYLPAILFQIVAAPFILKPVVGSLYPASLEVMRPAARPAPVDRPDRGRTSIAISKQRGFVTEEVATPPVRESRPVAQSVNQAPRKVASLAPSVQELSGFERAVRYIGEHGSVHLTVVVDSEGLTLAGFKRGEFEPEDWAPLALLFVENNSEVLHRGCTEELEKLDLQLKQKRLVVARSSGCSLMVLSERHDDDLLSIRINQAMDMIEKFVVERYGDKLNPNAEKIHVSSAQ